MRSYVIKPGGRVIGLRVAPLPVPTSLRVRAMLPPRLPRAGRANRQQAHRSGARE